MVLVVIVTLIKVTDDNMKVLVVDASHLLYVYVTVVTNMKLFIVI